MDIFQIPIQFGQISNQGYEEDLDINSFIEQRNGTQAYILCIIILALIQEVIMIEIVDGYLINDDNIKIAFTNRNVDAKNSEDMKNFSAKYGFNHDNIVYNTQVHGADVRIVESEDNVAENGEEADGLITNLKNTPLLIFTADCVPVVFYDKKQGVVALAHAGWRGTYGNIAGEMVNIMINKYNCKV